MKFPVFEMASVVVVVMVIRGSTACKSATWRNMSMEEMLLKSSVVVYGKDVGHGKFRLPSMLDARFDVYCVIKKGFNLVPGQVIIEDILNDDDPCSGAKSQTEAGQEYIVGLQREFSGFMTYSKVNPLQKTAFPVTTGNLNKLAATCGLDEWSPPSAGNQDLCPPVNKPRFCTKFRDPDSLSFGMRVSQPMYSYIILIFTIVECLLFQNVKI